ncbi:MAG: XRE family transcriptional regulator [Ignavibacteriae bacterium HGW-Ignavibacteriae-3]|nr:MAG: XRE family transcriptional regulator [Ignavibacteriae bacterium HGW-Ignavibacteriae-3]
MITKKTTVKNNGNYIKLIFGLKVKQLRQEKHLSLIELARKSSLSISYLNEIEKGKKYPKAEKIVLIANALDVNYNDLISLKLSKNLTPIAELIDSNILEMLPLDHYGIDLNKFISLMSDASYQLSALVTTVIEMARNTELSQNNFSRTALRIFKEINENYLDDTELAVEKFMNEFHLTDQVPVNSEQLSRILFQQYNYKLDESRFADFDELKQLRGVVKSGKQPVLFLNPQLNNAHKLFIIGKELAYNYLNISKRSYIHSSLKLDTFDHLLNNYIASYFSAALILNKHCFVEDMNIFFSQKKWDDHSLINLIAKYDVTPEMFFQRLTNFAGREWGLKKYFFFRFNTHAGSDRYELSKEVRLNIKQFPGGYQTDEHYCRRWVSIAVLKKLKEEVDGLTVNRKMKLGIIHSRFHETNDEYISFSVAQQNILNPNTFTSVTLGFYLDEQLKKTIKFWNDPAIPFRIVNDTCEMCSIPDCKERISEPLSLEKIHKSRDIETAINKL